MRLIEKLSNLKDRAASMMKPAAGKMLMGVMAVSVLSFVPGSETAAANNETQAVYNVYMNNKFLGTTSDKAVIEKIAEKKLDIAKLIHKNLDITMGPDLQFVPEQVFQSLPFSNEAKRRDELQSKLSIRTEACAIILNGKSAAYVKDKEEAEAVLKKLKQSFISKEEMEALQEKDKQESLPPLKENETRILDVKLTKKVETASEEVDPKRVLTVDEAVSLLKNGSLNEEKYRVQEGDVLGSIANKHDLKLEEILQLNPGLNDTSVLKPGQEVMVMVKKPLVEVAVEKEIFVRETVPFSKEVEEDDSMPKGDSKLKQKGKNGEKTVHYKVMEVNGVEEKKDALKSDVIAEPVAEITVKGTKEIPSRGTGMLVWPASGGYVSSERGYRWGRMHKGIDIARPGDRTIKAADNGTVVSAGWSGSYGNKIIIDHQNGFRTLYAHLDSISVSAGQTVEVGSAIGIMGSTGDSTGVHLHFEVYRNGQIVNPRDYIQ
ncbi:peptidoglycan DD-metalloendopeptidase family protein [Bacillus massilinigeriensis]|uniref:peptidoglycan DD-metalloendopeptidase family protein n=1 Tax=Bacillus mediterraneensis TaxID=1805474 RepID=UPI000A8AEC5E|nr:peptidoglycan DD-metalloendopeptidase family protein [Bacillus mediterraneensis]